MDVTQPLRRHLWNIHTKGLQRATSDVADDAAQGRETIIKRNSRNQSGGLSPIASLIGFMWTSTGRLRLD
jgi:hypothetical protein